jgi:hypothetical protein
MNHSLTSGGSGDILYHVMWRMNRRCNYRCDHCLQDAAGEAKWEEHPDCARHSPEHISSCSNSTGRRWHAMFCH